MKSQVCVCYLLQKQEIELIHNQVPVRKLGSGQCHLLLNLLNKQGGLLDLRLAKRAPSKLSHKELNWHHGNYPLYYLIRISLALSSQKQEQNCLFQYYTSTKVFCGQQGCAIAYGFNQQPYRNTGFSLISQRQNRNKQDQSKIEQEQTRSNWENNRIEPQPPKPVLTFAKPYYLDIGSYYPISEAQTMSPAYESLPWLTAYIK